MEYFILACVFMITLLQIQKGTFYLGISLFTYHLSLSHSPYSKYTWLTDYKMEKCFYGTMNDEECHKLTYISISCKNFIWDFDPVEREVLMWHSGLSLINADADVCLHHEYVLFKRYELMEKKCCDPFQSHQKTRKGRCHFFSHYYCIIINCEVSEKFSFNLISHLKSIYVKWSMIQHGET